MNIIYKSVIFELTYCSSYLYIGKNHGKNILRGYCYTKLKTLRTVFERS